MAEKKNNKNSGRKQMSDDRLRLREQEKGRKNARGAFGGKA